MDISNELKERILNRDGSTNYMEKFNPYIQKLNLNEYTLSFSAIQSFSKSPLHFLRYKTGMRKVTDAMEFGTLLHLLILEPHLFEENYLILHKAKGFENNTWSKGENKAQKLKIETLAAENNKKVISIDNLELALDLKDNILTNSYAGDLIRSCHTYEQPIKFEWNNETWTGFVDGKAHNYIVDLKKVPDANPEKLKWQQVREKWAWQGFLYLKGCNMPLNDEYFFYNICYDGDGNVTVIRQSWMSLMSAKTQIELCCEKLNECIVSENWNYSYEFYTDMGYYNAFEL